ncbi:MAG TPA: bacteriohopanetetrol glucosamine biosynthesis glycosyltransferase HpnI [Acetobacteraceae bacterium]|nr:bacteriohopanetetrol glucosamine biosynthesis glycosyltransferase HpnI [Acetobacteraceae bacterium]
MLALAGLAAALAVIGAGQCAAGALAVVRFCRRPRAPAEPGPPVTVLKPLHGDEPLLDAALGSVCRQDYPAFQVVFGVQDAADPAIRVVRRLQARFPGRDLALVVDPTQHGPNRKVANLINMMRAARHDILVIADSDLHCAPDYVSRLVAALRAPGTGLVTTLYAGLPATPALPARLGATQITHAFLPGALLARAMGRRDCLGATMALRRETLAAIGGLAALVGHLADDNALGRKVAGLGLAVRLADTVPLTTVPEASFVALFRHELRWARTIRALVPAGFAASALQYPIAWALLALLLSAGAVWAWMVLAAAWVARAASAWAVDRALGRWLPREPAITAPTWLLPLRDLMSVVVMAASYAGLEVEWRGHRMHADGPAPASSVAAPSVKD